MLVLEVIVLLLAGMCLGISITKTAGTSNQRWFFFIIFTILMTVWGFTRLGGVIN